VGADLVRISLSLQSEEDTIRLAQTLATVIRPNLVIGLVGPLGAGKTRFTRALAEALGVDPQSIASPTFVLIHEYEGRLPIYHFDTYRLNSIEAFEALGPDDYWSAGGVCLVEWADHVAPLLPMDSWWIRFSPTGLTERQVTIETPANLDLTSALVETEFAPTILGPED
jgi:tRNA threonylcarbamoyladenosine biosynthesis protein TsaE